MTENEIAEVNRLLNKLEPGFLPEQIFYQISRLAVLSAAEIAVLRRNSDKIEALLIKRPDDDPFFAGLWHTPGSMYISGDSIEKRPHEVLKNELPNTKFTSELKYLLDSEIVQYARGNVLERIYMIEASDSSDGVFFPIDDLPSNLVTYHDKIIEIVANKLKG